MNAEHHTACASSTNANGWHQIDWTKQNRNVRRLQARIVKATEEGRWGKVQALQWLLTHSFSGKAVAVRRVSENKGRKTPGVDGATWPTPKEKAAAITSLQRRGYKPQPLRRIYIPKANGKLRPLGIPTMKDRAMQALYLLALDPVSETTADKNSYGFRKARSAHDALEQCFKVFGKASKSAQWVLEADIEGCFDNISHEWMMTNIPLDKGILRKWLKAGFVENRALHATTAGTPQGGIISPTLANMVLDGLEHHIASHFRKRKQGGKVIDPKINLVRYADDFVISGASQEVLEQVRETVVEFLRERGLRLSVEKTKIVHISEGFTFLGQNVRMFGDKLLITPSKRALVGIYDKVREIVTRNKSVEQRDLIRMLNPVIQGWVNYHRHAVSSVAFSKLDRLIWQLLWQWAVRRHRNKGKTWIRNRYWRRLGTRDWTFACEVDSERGWRVSSLVYATNTKIKRHVKVSADVNPYASKWSEYLAERHVLTGANSLNGRVRLLNLWMAQEGRCLECNGPINRETGWDVHHTVRSSDGGSDRKSNLRLLHRVCHLKLHANSDRFAAGSVAKQA